MTEVQRASQLCIELIDDDVDQRLAVAALLGRRGFRNIVQAADAEEGVRLAHEQPPHLILLDLAMPGRSGLEALPDLRAAATDAAIVVFSNLPRRRFLGDVLRSGAVGFIEKSTPPSRLVDELLIAAALTELGHSHVLELPPSVAALSHGRRFARDLLSDRDRQLVDDIMLLVGELVTNAAKHARSPDRLEIHLRGSHIRVEVFDHDPAPPRLREPDRDAPGGRGLHIVSALSNRWGYEHLGPGKVVWIEVDDQRAPRAPSPSRPD